MQIVEGKLFALFSFDVGYEIDLARLRRERPEGGRPRGGRKGGGPTRVEYQTPPLILPAGTRRLVLVERQVEAAASVRVHEFGAVTVVFDVPFGGRESAEALPALTAALATDGDLEAEARAVLDEVFPQILPAVTRPNLDGAGPVDDYYVLQIGRFDGAVDAAALLGAHRELLARIVHCEPEVLSASEIDEVFRTAVTYTPNDLVLTDWNVALVYDEEYEDVLNVLELLNVQLLELRYLDAMLDRRINAIYELIGRPRCRVSFRRETVRVRELSELRLDTAALRERMVNALKLIGDLYLTKIHARTADRLHIQQWQRSVDGKLELIQNISEVFANRAATTRAELLELTIIILIAVEIALFLAM